MCNSFGIDEGLAKIVKSYNVSKIKLLTSFNDYGKVDFENKVADGICALYVRKDNESIKEIHRVVYRNKQKYLAKGYELFYFQGNQHGEYYYFVSFVGQYIYHFTIQNNSSLFNSSSLAFSISLGLSVHFFIPVVARFDAFVLFL